MFGLVCESVIRRKGEFAIRLAVGSSPGQILRLVLAEVLRNGTIGVALGAWMGVLLHGAVQATLPTGSEPSPLVLLGMPALMYVVMSLAVLLPAARASRTDPGRLLRA